MSINGRVQKVLSSCCNGYTLSIASPRCFEYRSESKILSDCVTVTVTSRSLVIDWERTPVWDPN